MTCLLDVNVLLAAIWSDHPLHERAFAGIKGKRIMICPLTELGFIRISTNPKASINAPMEKTRQLLHQFVLERNAGWIPDDLRALESKSAKSEDVTDNYLAELAARHEMKLLTLDSRIKHPSAMLV
jgi:predicted nucleic acid-binding protein